MSKIYSTRVRGKVTHNCPLMDPDIVAARDLGLPFTGVELGEEYVNLLMNDSTLKVI